MRLLHALRGKFGSIEYRNKETQRERCIPWFMANGDRTLRLEYPLNTGSVVLDVGGYKGDFAADIFCKYGCKVYVFEPVEVYYKEIRNRFLHNPQIVVYDYGLGPRSEVTSISLKDDKSSLYLSDGDLAQVRIKSISEFIYESKLTNIDLLKLNTEGSEYEILENLIFTGEIAAFKNIQVQFHDFLFEGAEGRMNRIQSMLAKTHSITWQYKFVWENWQRKDR